MDLADEIEVRHAFAPSATRRAAFAERFPFPLCDSLDTILADPGTEAVAVFTPPNTHAEIGLACARAGKHVLMEKPLEITTARAEELVAGCRAAGVRMGVVLQHRFRPAALRAAEILASGRLGRLVGASARVRLWRPQSLLRRARPRHHRPRRRRGAGHPGDPHARPDAQPRRGGGRGDRLRRHHAGAPDGDRRHGLRRAALRERRPGGDRGRPRRPIPASPRRSR